MNEIVALIPWWILIGVAVVAYGLASEALRAIRENRFDLFATMVVDMKVREQISLVPHVAAVILALVLLSAYAMAWPWWIYHFHVKPPRKKAA